MLPKLKIGLTAFSEQNKQTKQNKTKNKRTNERTNEPQKRKQKQASTTTSKYDS